MIIIEHGEVREVTVQIFNDESVTVTLNSKPMPKDRVNTISLAEPGINLEPLVAPYYGDGWLVR